jgi:hypothetical protein
MHSETFINLCPCAARTSPRMPAIQSIGTRVIWKVPVPIEQPEEFGLSVNVPAPLFASGCIAPLMLKVMALPPIFTEPLSWRFEIASPPGKMTWPLSVLPVTVTVEKQLDSCSTLLKVAFSAWPFC